MIKSIHHASVEITVPFHDVDMMEVVWHGHYTKYFEVARKIAKAQMKAFDTDWILSKIMGDEIPHAHIWVFPNNQIKADKKDFEGNS